MGKEVDPYMGKKWTPFKEQIVWYDYNLLLERA